MIEGLISAYKKKKKNIKKRLCDFQDVWKQSNKKIFSELCFCVCTPQSKAVYCDKAVSGLEKSGVLYNGSIHEVRKGLKAVRFPNNKARFIVENRKLFTSKGSLKIKDKINTDDIIETRQWFVKNVIGIGFKEASHFLRNIGFGRDLAILDVHILKNMLRYGIVDELPKTLTKSNYLMLEEKLRGFSEEITIPMDELDLLFWSSETGEIFK